MPTMSLAAKTAFCTAAGASAGAAAKPLGSRTALVPGTSTGGGAGGARPYSRPPVPADDGAAAAWVGSVVWVLVCGDCAAAAAGATSASATALQSRADPRIDGPLSSACGVS